MSRKQILAIVAALLVLAGVYFKIPAPVVEALEKAVAVFADEAAQPTPVAPKSDAEAGAPGQ
jgi:type II secretory pathway component PulM